MDTNKSKYAYVGIIFGFLLLMLIAALYSPAPRTSDAADDRINVRGAQDNSSVSSFLNRIIGEPNEAAGEPKKSVTETDEIVADLRKMTDESDILVDSIWYAGTWDPTLYLNARYPRTVAIRMKLLDKKSHLPIKGVGVSLRGEYEHKWTGLDAQDQINTNIFPDLIKLKSQRRKFGFDAISDSEGFVVFSLNWQKEYSWKAETENIEGSAAVLRPGDIECAVRSRITHPDCKNAEIPMDLKRITVLKPVVLDLGERFPDFKNKHSRRIEFFEKIKAEDYSIAYRDVKDSTDPENKTKCGPYFVYDLGEVLLECTAPPRKVSHPDSIPEKTVEQTDRTKTDISAKTQEPKDPLKTTQPRDQIAQESKPDQKSSEQPKPVDQTAAANAGTPKVSQTGLKETTIDLGDGVTMRLVLIPAGEFQMGSSPTEIGRDADEGPVHTVRIDQPFYMSVYEVTQEQYEKVLGMNPSKYTGPRYPVHMVSWNDAQIFCQSVSSQIDKRFRLPTEAEWEYACRAGTSTAFYWGYGYDGRYAWSLDNSKGTLHEVGTRLPNAWGLYDMSGNLWEWCEDSYDEYHLISDELMNLKETSPKSERILRGGSWNIKPLFSRSANRSRNVPHVRMDYNGFRVVLDVK